MVTLLETLLAVIVVYYLAKWSLKIGFTVAVCYIGYQLILYFI